MSSLTSPIRSLAGDMPERGVVDISNTNWRTYPWFDVLMLHTNCPLAVPACL